MATEVSSATTDESAEIGTQIELFTDRFEPYKQPVSCDASEAQLREQISDLEALRSEVNAWGREFLQRHGLVDGLMATFLLEAAIEDAIDDRFKIILG